MKGRNVLGIPLMVLALAAIGIGVTLVSADGKPQPPFVRPPDDVYLRQAAEIDAKNKSFLSDFVANRRDPRSLPRVNLHGWATGPSTLAEAVAQAETAIVARVTKTTFMANPSGGLPVARVSLAVDQLVFGQAAESVELIQLGGPMPGDDTGIFVQLESDEVLLPGDAAVLLVTRSPDGSYAAVPAAGIYRLEGGRIQPIEANTFRTSIRGLDLASFLGLLRSAKS